MEDRYILTNDAIQHLKDVCKPILCDDYIGYVAQIPFNKHVYALFSLDGWVYFCPESKYKLTDRRAYKILKRLVKMGWLEPDFDIFPGFESLDFNEKDLVAVQGDVESVVEHFYQGDILVYD